MIRKIYDDRKVYKSISEAKKELSKSKIPSNKLCDIKSMEFTDVIPGEKCNTGGEYGFYSVYNKIEKGIYEFITTTTAMTKNTLTGFEGYVILTKEDYDRLDKEEDEVFEIGCYY